MTALTPTIEASFLSQSGKRGYHGREVRNKMRVVVRKSEETLYNSKSLRMGPFEHCQELPWIHLQTWMQEHRAQEG